MGDYVRSTITLARENQTNANTIANSIVHWIAAIDHVMLPKRISLKAFATPTS
jgi:hypothetical protein